LVQIRPEKFTEEIKNHTNFQFETLKGRDTLGDLGLDEMLKTI
jgi:hypothetical protein